MNPELATAAQGLNGGALRQDIGGPAVPRQMTISERLNEAERRIGELQSLTRELLDFRNETINVLQNQVGIS